MMMLFWARQGAGSWCLELPDPTAPFQAAELGELRRHWRLVAACLLGFVFCGLPGSAVGVFITPWVEENGWSLSLISGLATFLGLGVAAADPLIGRWMDRFGARPVVLIYIPTLALAVASMYFMGRSVWTLYAVMFVWGCIGAGGGAYVRAINLRFTRQRGTALGLAFIGVGIGGAAGPPLAQWMVEGSGWRAGCLWLAVTVLLAWPPAMFWIHGEGQAGARSVEAVSRRGGYTRQEALRMRVFWFIGSACFLSALTAGAGLFLIPFLTEKGMSPAVAASCVSIWGMSAMVGQPLFGMAIDRLNASLVATTAFAVYALAFITLGLSGSRYAVPVVIMLGLAQSAWVSYAGYCVARYFGLRAFGEISGLIGRMGAIGVMIGPVVFSLLHDATGDYTVPYVVAGGFALCAAVCLAMTGRHPFLSNV